jgi:hypothetical protein
MAGFLGKKQYAEIPLRRFTRKLSKDLCLECSICAMFFNSSLIVSIKALFLSKSLSETDINAPFMLLFNLVISCILSTNSLLNRFWLITPLSSTNFPCMNLMKGLYSRGLLSSISPEVNIKLRSSPLLITDQMELESEEPSHGALTSCRYSLEDPMHLYSLITAYS